MSEFIFINCPNCRAKIKIDREKKYHDCEECKFEFRLEQVEPPDNAQSMMPQTKRPMSGAEPPLSLLEKLQKLRDSDA
jgi:DNA-directed RNA polymerase subunit RPC12/RpoP